jgi:hypothetical protein
MEQPVNTVLIIIALLIVGSALWGGADTSGNRLNVEVGKKSAKRVRRAWAASRGGGNKQPSSLVALDKTCRLCHRPLIEIEHYGERLIGCMYCNRWAWEGSQDLLMALPEQDLQALGNLSNARHKAEDTTP